MRSPLDGIVTLALTILAFLAFDDITTDDATTFTVEYSLLAVCAVWVAILSVRLALQRCFALSGISFCVLVAALWGQRFIGPGTVPSLQPYYLATVFSIVWFLGLSVYLFASGLYRIRRAGLAAR
jgi:ABC-type polysaccharide/polyol phosphate export permease